MRWIPALAAALLAACGGPLVEDDGYEPIEQHPECAHHVQCSRAVEEQAGLPPEPEATLEGEYGPDGACWGDEARAAACRDDCVRWNDDAAEAFPGVPECHWYEGMIPEPQ